MYMKTKNESAVFKLFLLFAAVLLCSLFSPGADAKAASNRTLSTGRTYTAYDVTGDGKADTIRLTKGGYTSYDMYTSLTVTVNGSTAYTYKDAYYYGFSVKLLTLNNGKVFLFITGWGDNDDGSAHLLQYKNSTKKFKKIADFGTMFYKYGFHVNSNVQSVSGNKIVIRTNLMSYSLAGVSFDMTFSYKSGSLTPASKLTVNYVNSG
ncbi:MAG: hypothetical protein LUI07_02580, partial [Lachnospiraceae bacterium]|nr:hypothetical protein [Lachnospiraceae bacterium]